MFAASKRMVLISIFEDRVPMFVVVRAYVAALFLCFFVIFILIIFAPNSLI